MILGDAERALVSGIDAGKLGDPRCEVRDGLIQFLCRNYPESLPRSRNVNIDDKHPKNPRRGKIGAVSQIQDLGSDE